MTLYRAYITFDILRRIMSNYFGYHIQYVMNITDIDDKIITGARHAHLFKQYVAAQPSAAQLGQDVRAAIAHYKGKRFGSYLADGDPEDAATWARFAERVANGTVDKQGNEKFDLHFKTLSRAVAFAEGQLPPPLVVDAMTLEPVRDALCLWLDHHHGSTVTDQGVFREFSRHWEGEFFKDMDALNILRPTVLTRVSEFVPEVVDYISVILRNGYAYEEDGSVYFHTTAFKQHHHYAKLEPWSASNSKLLAEGEGDLSQSKCNSDFVLWKRSKAGEPSWPSPWGPGRPGWHIECSVMACHVFGDKLDIHSGGIDLAFPHHDNEIAQVEAHYNSDQWTNYFLHAGHLHIAGMKMSKSLKNFVTIQDALKEASACTLRIMFLLHPWNSLLDYGPGSMGEAKAFEQALRNFQTMTRALVGEERRAQQQAGVPTAANTPDATDASPAAKRGPHGFHEREKALSALVTAKDAEIHAAVCDSFNTPLAMQHLRELISAGNAYYNESLQRKLTVHTAVLVRISDYVLRWMDIFGAPIRGDGSAPGGVAGDGTATSGVDREAAVLPVAQALSDFRDAVKELSVQGRPAADYLALCDKLRDVECVDLGILLSDRSGGGKALVKLVDPAVLKEQATKERKAREAKQEAIRKLNEAQEAKRREVEARWAIAPVDYFKTLAAQGGAQADVTGDAYTAWDAEGVPTASAQDGPISKSRRKKLEKEMATQRKHHAAYQESVAAAAAGNASSK